MGILSLKEQSLFSHIHTFRKLNVKICLFVFFVFFAQFVQAFVTLQSARNAAVLTLSAWMLQFGFLFFLLKGFFFGSHSPSCWTFTSTVFGHFSFFWCYSDLRSLPALDLNFFSNHQCCLWSRLKHLPTKLSSSNSSHICILGDFPKQNVLNVEFYSCNMIVAFYFW